MDILSWDVLAFESDEYEQQLSEACTRVGATLSGYEVTPSFRYVVRASREQIFGVVALVPWIKYYYRSEIRNAECTLIETDR
jgi:hypothetical protein